MTPSRQILVAFVLALACATPAFANAPSAPKEQATLEAADAEIDRISSNTGKYLLELDRAIELAKKGTYGKLPKGSSAKLDEARDLIGDLLKGDRDPRDLPDEQRLAIYNAHSTIESIINNDDKSRVVCKREQHLGSRVATTECLTIGEREELAWHSSQETADLIRNVCNPGEGNPCSKD